MVYQWKIPEIYSNISAQEAGAEIESCKNAEGFITPNAVVEKAKPETSVIHSCFEWDDAAAAEQFRLRQAAYLLRNIVTVDVFGNGAEESPEPVRAFVNIKSDEERGYKTITAVLDNRDEYSYMLECAKGELRAFTKKYAVLKELSGVLSAIQEVLT